MRVLNVKVGRYRIHPQVRRTARRAVPTELSLRRSLHATSSQRAGTTGRRSSGALRKHETSCPLAPPICRVGGKETNWSEHRQQAVSMNYARRPPPAEVVWPGPGPFTQGASRRSHNKTGRQGSPVPSPVASNGWISLGTESHAENTGTRSPACDSAPRPRPPAPPPVLPGSQLQVHDGDG